jgi:hypothetical protein
MNFAMLFHTESDSKRFAKRNGIPDEYQSVFIPITIKEVVKPTQQKKYYNVLNRGSLDEAMPEFLK